MSNTTFLIVPPLNANPEEYIELTGSALSYPMHRPSPHSEKWPITVRISASPTSWSSM